MTAIEVSKILGSEHVSKSKGVFKYWKSYFYRHGMTVAKLEEHVKLKFPNAVITNGGDHWHSFCGGAKSGSAQDSHMWVKFVIPMPQKFVVAKDN